MRKHNITAFLFLAAILLCIGCSQEVDYEGYQQRISSSLFDLPKLKEIHNDVSRDLAKKPDDDKLLLLRMQLSGMIRDEPTLEADTYKLAELFPNQPFYQFQRCLIMERHFGLNSMVRKCYSDILPLYEDALDQTDLTLRWDYVVTALMAESPQAAELRERFIQAAGDAPELWHDKQFLKYFKRDMLLTGKLPPEMSLEEPPPPKR